MSDYWKKRALEQQKAQHKRIDDMTEELAEYWERAIREVENDILAWYARFAREQGVTLQEAHRLLDTRDMKALRMSLKEFEEKARENKDGRWEKELAAASARVHISRLEQLELSIRNKLYELYHETEDVTAQALRDTYTDETYHNEYRRQQAEGRYSTFSEIPDDAVDKVLSKPWTADGHNWSDRLWQNRETLAGKLQGELVRMLVRGDTPVDAGKRLAKEMGVGLYQAARLVQTECTYAQTLADLETADKLGADKMEYVATLEMHTCGTCGELDGSVIERKYLEPGVNAPPMHPHCRCTLVPYYEDNDTTRWARDPDTGKGSKTEDMTYSQWEKKYLIGLKHGKIDTEIDALTSCLIRMKDGKIVNTMMAPITVKKGQFSDWEFDWYKAAQKPDMQVYALKADGDERVQGLISMKKKESNKAYFIDVVESAPWNNKHHKKFKSKVYEGVGAHLFAYACKRSRDDGFDGFVYFDAKSKLIDYYRFKLGAAQVGGSQRMYIPKDSAERLVARYYDDKKR